jgi:hypothetical protein
MIQLLILLSILCAGTSSHAQSGDIPEMECIPSLVSSIRVKPPLDFCGEPAPLDSMDARERLERELLLMLWDRDQTIMWLKRANRYMPYIQTVLKDQRLPDDLKYIPVVESALRALAGSPKGAMGYWQFIKDTAKREGLSVGDTIDERFSVKRSTKSALSYLKKLNSEFGDWFLAMAAYNCGEGRVREAISNQNTKDFFELFLPEETERYIYRVAALKEIVSNAKKYGLSIEKRQFYRPYSIWEAAIEVRKDVHTLTLAQAMDLPYKAFREYNLHIRRYTLPKGIYYLYVPVEKREIFLKRIKTCPGVSLEKNGNEPAKDNGS